ncbi:unnamed protein product [Dovyalis caffra]|uniref:Uncharacterized protein n=1 Tax=Dovyalis caffra TaxID=77055 RepID=A0AAV1SFI0_9ROSI|nr:unnamed protein product [Dovyalis caffra]
MEKPQNDMGVGYIDIKTTNGKDGKRSKLEGTSNGDEKLFPKIGMVFNSEDEVR